MELWSERYAKKAMERAEREGKGVVISTGITPSGIIHIGNANEPIRAYYIKEAVEELGGEVSDFHWISDDRDALRKVPNRLMDPDGGLVEPGGEVRRILEENLGKPVNRVPDPFGCHDSYADHFRGLFKEEMDALGIEIRIISADEELYGKGILRDVLLEVVEKRRQVVDILNRFRDVEFPGEFPMRVICEKCGRLHGRILEIKGDRVHYVCEDVVYKGKKILGCGYEGWTSIDNVKLSWRVDWAARWKALGVTLEPMGKDHAAAGSSYDTSSLIAREVLNYEPPIPVVYEHFLLNGEKISGSKGNVITVREFLQYVDPGELIFFFGKRPGKARDMRMNKINQIVMEHDLGKEVYHGKREARGERDLQYARIYYYAHHRAPEYQENIPYETAAYLSVLPEEKRVKFLAEKYGIVTEAMLRRIEKAGKWARDHAPEFLVSVSKEAYKPEDWECEILRALLENPLPETVKKKAEEFGVPARDAFRSVYRIMIGREHGPRVDTLLYILGEEGKKRILEVCGDFLNSGAR